MKEPKRLMHDGSLRAKELLASLDEDVPPDPLGGQERLLRALDLAPNGAVVPRERPQGPKRAWLALAATSGLLVLSAAFVVSPRDGSMAVMETRAPRPEPVAAPTVEARAEAPSAPAEATAAASQTVDVHALAPAAPDDRGSARAAPRGITRKDVREAAPASTPSPATATDELALLEGAQRAASQGHPAEALALVERHRREFPRGKFGVEMSVVEIEALARTGRIEDAAARGERFLEHHPGSPYTRRVEAVVRAKNQKEKTR